MARLLVLLMLGSLMGNRAAAAQAGATLLRSDGSQTQVGSVGLDPAKGCTFTAGGEVRSVPLDDVAELRFPPVRSFELGAETAVVHLHDGSFLVGQVAGGNDEELQFELAAGVRMSLSIDAVKALFLGPRARMSQPDRFQTGTESDYIFRRPESGGDFTTGTLISFGASALSFEYRLGEEEFPLREIEGLVLSLQIDLPPVEGAQVEVDLAPDGRLAGTFVGMDDAGLALQPLLAEEPVVLPLPAVLGVRFPGSRHRWLSDLDPATVEEVPFLGDPEVFLYPHRLDRSVTGRPLSVGERRFSKGLGCHSRTVLGFDVEGLGMNRFRAEVGVCDEVLDLSHRGSLVFEVLVDGESRFRSDAMHAGEAAVLMGPIDLTGARRLTLITDFGADEDIADRGAWGGALLWKE